MIMSKLLGLLGSWKHEIVQVLILVVAVLTFKYYSDPPQPITITKVETKIEKVIEYVDRVTVKEVEKIVYKDRVVTRTVTKPSGTVIQTVTVDRGTTEYIEKELQVEEILKESENRQTTFVEHNFTPKISRWSLAVEYNLSNLSQFMVKNLGVEGGIRIANMPLWLTAGVGDLGRTYRAGLRLEF